MTDYLEGADKPCWVYAEGAWREGWILGEWYRSEGRWRARVEWSEGPGLTHRTSYWQEELRPRDEGPNNIPPKVTPGAEGPQPTS